MKRAQLLGVAIAGVCGLGAFFGVMSLVNKPTRVVKEEVTTNTTQVLVARTEIGLGQITGPESFRWLDWPQNAVSPSYIQRDEPPERDRGAEGLGGACADAGRRAGHGAEARQGRRRRRAGRDPARGHARHLHAHQGGDRRRPADPAQRPRRRHPHPPHCAAVPAATSSPRRRCSTTCACSPSASSSRPRTATRSTPRATPPRWSSPRPRRSAWRRRTRAAKSRSLCAASPTWRPRTVRRRPGAATTIRIIKYGVKSGTYGVN